MKIDRTLYGKASIHARVVTRDPAHFYVSLLPRGVERVYVVDKDYRRAFLIQYLDWEGVPIGSLVANDVVNIGISTRRTYSGFT